MSKRAALRFTMLTVIIVVVIMTMDLNAAWAVAADKQADELAHLERGDVLLQIVHENKSGGAARVSALFHSDANAIWNIIGYCKYAYIYLKGLKLCEVLEPGLIRTKLHHRVKNSWYTPTLDYAILASRAPGHQGSFRLVSGNLKILEGQWTLKPLAGADGFIVTHEIRIQPKFPTPKWLVRRSLRRDLPDMMACIRGLAYGSGDGTRMAHDLERCPRK